MKRGNAVPVIIYLFGTFDHSTVDVILKGDKIMTGLSDKTVARVRTEMDKSREKDTSGLGGAIASMVKKTVAENIGTHAVFPRAI